MTQRLLFDATALPRSDARLSPCGRYRHWLSRPVGSGPLLVFCLVNPSTADDNVDDTTVRKCVSFAKALGFGRLGIVNLFAWRATDPKDLVVAMQRGEDVVGAGNDDAIIDAARSAAMVIAGWGPKKWARERATHVTGLLSMVTDVHCLRRTADGSPEHPLFLPHRLQPEIYRPKGCYRA